MSVPEKHEKKILRDTVANPNKALLGGPSYEEAKRVLRKKYGYTDEQLNKLDRDASWRG